jgi:hypothetical protein
MNIEQVHADNAKWYDTMTVKVDGSIRLVAKYGPDTGPAPSPELYTAAHALTKALRTRRGSAAGTGSGFIAMCLRPEGCRITQHVAAFNTSPALNKLKLLVDAVPQLVTSEVVGRPYAYVLRLTTRGQAVVDAYISEATKPRTKVTKVKAKVKAKTKVTDIHYWPTASV